MNKYNAKKTEVDGVVFHSKKEADLSWEIEQTILETGISDLTVKSVERKDASSHASSTSRISCYEDRPVMRGHCKGPL